VSVVVIDTMSTLYIPLDAYLTHAMKSCFFRLYIRCKSSKWQELRVWYGFVSFITAVDT